MGHAPLEVRKAGHFPSLSIACALISGWSLRSSSPPPLQTLRETLISVFYPRLRRIPEIPFSPDSYPGDLADQYPRMWADGEDDEHSRNRNEEELLNDLLKRKHVKARVRYDKLVASKDGKEFQQSVHDLLQFDLSAVVVNFVDILAHSRSDSAVLKEIAPDERAYRSLTKTWFEHSWLVPVFSAACCQ